MDLKTHIFEIKKLISIVENTNLGSNVLVIGDFIANYLKDSDFNVIESLINDDMTVDTLIDSLSDQELNEDIDEVFVSIGTNDLFDPNTNTGTLIDMLYEFYPNARLHLIKGYANIYDYDIDEEEIEDIKQDAIAFFSSFKKDGVRIIGEEVTGKINIIGTDKVKRNSNFVDKLKNYILGFVYNFEIEDVAEVETDVFNDLDIDDKTDFDTIYEFLDLFEKIVKSNNVYSEKQSDKFYGDIEIIQIALMFLGYGSGVSNNGKFDVSTEEAIMDFQKSNGLTPNGIANKDTLNELFWELKYKGFDDDDLGKFIGKVGEMKKTYPVDSYSLQNYCDLIIDNIEGGYANEAHFKNLAKDVENDDIREAMENSSETMFGMDRINGNWDSHPVGSKFWQLIDENSGWAEESLGKPRWKHGYMGGSIEGKLRDYVYNMILPNFSKYKSSFLSSEAKKLVEEDKRITMHLLYACWNGGGFFEDFAETINNEVSNGNTDRDSLYDVAINSRTNYPNDLIKKTGYKVKDLINSL
jgi:hypothetical protein